jgi:hypothetical protein
VTVVIRVAENDLDGVVAGLREISDDDWEPIVDGAPSSTTSTLEPMRISPGTESG